MSANTALTPRPPNTHPRPPAQPLSDGEGEGGVGGGGLAGCFARPCWFHLTGAPPSSTTTTTTTTWLTSPSGRYTTTTTTTTPCPMATPQVVIKKPFSTVLSS
ncbi:unnamed protein product [Arctogadus glacialis]